MPDTDATTYKSNHWVNKLILGFLFAAFVFGLTEGLLGLAGFRHQQREKVLWNPKITGFKGTYQFFLETQFAPPGYIWISQPDTPYTDRFGFRLPEIPFDKPQDKTRIAFLGGSTTQGGYRPYPERTIRLINAAVGTDRYEVLNVACSSYSIHQSVKAFDRWVLPRNPDVVVVYHGWNDISVTPDGYSDREKDFLVSANRDPRFKVPRMLAQLRITQLLSWLHDKSDRSWPRQRVSNEHFAEGLEYIAQRCEEYGIRMIVLVRPSQRAESFVFDTSDAGPAWKKHMLNHFGTVDPAIVYQRQAKQITDIQKSLAVRHDHVDAFEGDRWMDSLIERQLAGEFGPEVRIFRSDNCHLYEFGDELLAQQLAMTVAPDASVAISNRIASVDYLMEMALEFYREDAPREAAWFTDQALGRAQTADQIKAIHTLLNRSVEKYPFVDRFRAGRMGGDIHDYDTKIRMLKLCLEERPSDYGVMIQIYLVSFAMGHAGDAAGSMSAFEPLRSDHERDWLYFTLESHVEEKRLDDARATAERLLRLDPGNTLAQFVINHGLPGQPL